MKSKDSLKVTVVMAAYREKEAHIRKAIESIQCQTMTDFEFIIILDDPQNIALKNIIEEYAVLDHRISIYVNERNLGCPRSKDRGIRIANTQYIAIMDADDIAKQERLEKQLCKMVEDRLDIIAGCVRVINDKGAPLYSMENLPLEHDDIAKRMRVNNCMPHPTWFLRKDVYIRLGGYMDMQGCEDYDFLIRAIKEGYRLGMVKDIILDYRLSENSVSRNSLFKQYLMMQYLQDKYYTHRYNYQSYNDIYSRKYTEARAERYAKASVYFEEVLSNKNNKKYFKMLVSIVKVLSSSKDYCVKILRYVMQNG